MLLLSIMLFFPQLKITVTRFFLPFFLVKLVTYIIIHSNILLLTCIYVLPFICHCIICFYLFTLWRFNKVNQSINKNIIINFARLWGGGVALKSKNIVNQKNITTCSFYSFRFLRLSPYIPLEKFLLALMIV